MFPEDRVLVGVINRRRDLNYARDQHWYRIPQTRMPRGIFAEYLAFFLSGKTFAEQSGGIHYFAKREGVELAYRRDLLPAESKNRKQNDVYYRVSLSEWREKAPPVLNPTRRPVSFIYTTWDRFVKATTIAELYSAADYYVDRLFHALRERARRHPLDQYWQAEQPETGKAPGIRILCQHGIVEASTSSGADVLLDPLQPVDAILKTLLLQMQQQGGPPTLPMSHD
jgi:hypothetical protein